MKNELNYTTTSKYSTVPKESCFKTIQTFQESLLDIKERIHQHVESTTPLIYLDAIKDVLNTQNLLERRLNVLRDRSSEKSEEKSDANLKFELASISRDIHELKFTVSSITQNRGEIK